MKFGCVVCVFLNCGGWYVFDFGKYIGVVLFVYGVSLGILVVLVWVSIC